MPFAVTLFLPKHIGKYIRKLLFTLLRYCLKLAWLTVASLWRVMVYFISLLSGSVRVLQRGRR